MIRDLKPCPFCGSRNLHDAYVTIKCLDCLAQGPATNGGNNDSHADWPDHERAIELWNKAIRSLGQGVAAILPDHEASQKKETV